MLWKVAVGIFLVSNHSGFTSSASVAASPMVALASSMASIVDSITYGRPNGMPAFQGRMTPQQIWQVAAYVRTLSARDRQDVRAGRAEGLSTGEPATLRDPKKPVAVTLKQDEASVQ